MFFSAALLDEFASLWFQAPLVISSRMQDLAATAGTPESIAETGRMFTEKLSAAAESFVALSTAMANEGMIAATAAATGTCSSLTDASDRVAVAALKPYGKRIRANARRLAK